MKMIDIIEKKKRGGTLTKEEISFFVDGYVAERIPDYQASALLMAIWFNGMTDEETFDLTMAMKYSGDVLDLFGENIALSKTGDGGVTVRADVNYAAMIRFAKTFAPDVKVLAPANLVDDVKKELQKALNAYNA